MLRNTERAWGFMAKGFHWLLAILIIGQMGLGKFATETELSPQKLDLFVWHKSIGILILFLVVLRAAWRWNNPPPATVAGLTSWDKRLARAGHGLLYVFMIVVPLSGWWISDTSRIPFKLFWFIPVPDFMEASRDMSHLAAEVHGVLTTLFLILVSIHILAALRHHFLLHNDTLQRMLVSRHKRRV